MNYAAGIYFRQNIKKSQIESLKQSEYSTHYCSPLRKIVAYEFLLVLAAEDFDGWARGDLLEGRKLQNFGANVYIHNQDSVCLY